MDIRLFNIFIHKNRKKSNILKIKIYVFENKGTYRQLINFIHNIRQKARICQWRVKSWFSWEQEGKVGEVLMLSGAICHDVSPRHHQKPCPTCQSDVTCLFSRWSCFCIICMFTPYTVKTKQIELSLSDFFSLNHDLHNKSEIE